MLSMFPASARPAARTACLAAMLALTPAYAQQAAPAPAPDTVVAKVDGMTITERDLDIAAEDLGGSLPQMGEAQRRDYLIAYMADLKLGARAARDAKVADRSDVQRRLAYQGDKVLLDEYLTLEAKKAVTEDRLKAFYADTVKELKPEMEVRARHILVEGEDEAKAIAKRIKGGEDFAKVAGEVSKDPGSGKEGGDLGWFTKDRMVPEFADAAFKLDKGQVSDPVKSQFGWHVIKVEDKRTRAIPPFEEVKDQIAQYLTRKSQTDIVMALRAKGKVERVDQPAAKDAAPAEPKKN